MESELLNKYDAFFEDEVTINDRMFERLLSVKKVVQRNNITNHFSSNLSHLLVQFQLSKNSALAEEKEIAPPPPIYQETAKEKLTSVQKNKMKSPPFISFKQMPRFLMDKLAMEENTGNSSKTQVASL